MKFLAQIPNPKDIFGTILPPPELGPFITPDKTGAAGISLFFNNLITLIYIIAAVVFIFMLLWGALEWISSGGDKEKVSNAKRRITHALVGITLFAVAFAIIRVVGIFTGFQFYNQQQQYYLEAGSCIHKRCPSGIDKPGECVFETVDSSKC